MRSRLALSSAAADRRRRRVEQVEAGQLVAVAERERGLALAQRPLRLVGGPHPVVDDRPGRLGRGDHRRPRRPLLGLGQLVVVVGEAALAPRQPPRGDPVPARRREGRARTSREQAERAAQADGDDPERLDDAGLADRAEAEVDQLGERQAERCRPSSPAGR